MRFTRREFIGLLGVLGASSCARIKQIEVPLINGGPDAFTFATINDPHLLDARSTAIVNRAVKSINDNREVRFTVMLGDLATAGRLGELRLAKESFSRLERPYFVVPGNHDVEPKSADIFRNYEKNFGEPTWTQEDCGWVFLGLDSCEGSSSDVTIQPARMAWLEKQIKHISPGRPIALFAHHPFNPNTKAYRVKNADEVLGMFSGHNLKLVAAGHYHGNQVEVQNGILFTTTACCSSTRPNFDDTPAKGYRLFHIKDETIETEFVEVSV